MRGFNTYKCMVVCLIGIGVTASTVQVLFILSAAHTNHFSGVDPVSTIVALPLFILAEAIVGLLLVSVMRFTGRSTISDPGDSFLLGLVLGCGMIGQLLHVWFKSIHPDLAVMGAGTLVLATAAAFSVKQLRQEG